jgi:hypothetical protein
MVADTTYQIIQITQVCILISAERMSSTYGRVQNFIKDKQPFAVYVHAAHILNLVRDAVSAVGLRDARAFFATMQELDAFFGDSLRGWDLLSSITAESSDTLKKLNPTC